MKKTVLLELQAIAAEILKINNLEDIAVLHDKSRMVYEKLTILNAIKLRSVENLTPAVVKKFEELASGVLTENRKVPENNPHEEDLIVPLMNSIKDLVAEMPKEETLDDILAEVYPNPTFIKKSGEHLSVLKTVSEEKKHEPKPPSKSILKRGITMGLNDRIGFIKHLFDENENDFNTVLSQLNSLTTKTEAKSIIISKIKPRYNYWKGKEKYEVRFLALIEAAFDV